MPISQEGIPGAVVPDQPEGCFIGSEFDSDELVRKCVSALDSQLRVTPLQYTVQTGIQADEIADEQLRSGDGFQVTNTATSGVAPSIPW